MTKKITAIILSIMLLSTCIVPVSVSAATVAIGESDIENATNVINNAVGEMGDDVFSAAEKTAVTSTFSSFLEPFKTAGSIITPINGVITFLKLTGIIKDSNTAMLENITTKLDIIDDKIDNMDQKLDKITEQMSKIQASVEFNTRTEKALMLQSAWKDFENRYMETGLDDLITQFNAKSLNGAKAWCENSTSRSSGSVDNSQIYLIYEKPTSDGEYTLRYTAKNGISGISADARYLLLDTSLLPDSVEWNQNSYPTDIKNAIKTNVLTAKNDGSYTFTAQNFDAFTNKTASEDLINQVAEDAANLILYRVTAKELNKDSTLSLQVVRQFANYCSHLLSENDGLDAMFKTMYLTHAFEYEIKDDFTAFCNQIAIKTGVYGVFALNVIGMSDYITDSQKQSTMENYCSALNTIGSCKTNGITGKNNYCYLTNTCLNFGEITLSKSANIVTKVRGSINGYESYSADPTTYKVIYGKHGTFTSVNNLLGDSGYLLLTYMLSSNGQKISYDYLNKTLGESSANDYGDFVVSMNSEQNMPLSDSKTQFWPTNVVGIYFNGVKSAYLNSLPGRAEQEYVNYHRQVTGSLVHTETGSMTSNTVLAAIAIYGENHWYWETDEAAFLGAPGGAYKSSVNKVRTGVDALSSVYYTSYYDKTNTYNCLVSIPYSKLTSDSIAFNPLSSYVKLCKEFTDSSSNLHSVWKSIITKIVNYLSSVLENTFAARLYCRINNLLSNLGIKCIF